MTCGNVVRGPLYIPGGGIENGPVSAVIRFWARRPVTCANAWTGSGGIDVRRECAGKFGCTPPCLPDRRRPDLRAWLGWGYAIAVETNTIAIGRRRHRVDIGSGISDGLRLIACTPGTRDITLLAWTWLTIWPLGAKQTATHATREDPSR